MQMDIQVERAAETLDQGNRAGARGGGCVSGLANEVRGECAIDDAQYVAHDLGTAGVQEAQGKGKARLIAAVQH